MKLQNRGRRGLKGEDGRVNVYMPAETKRRIQAYGIATNKSDSRVILEWIEEKLKAIDTPESRRETVSV